jgi:hypothetical protein
VNERDQHTDERAIVIDLPSRKTDSDATIGHISIEDFIIEVFTES